MSHLIVVGGFTENRRVLEPVAEWAFTHGFGEDPEVLTLDEARYIDEEELRTRMARTTVLTHSAGLMLLPDARGVSSELELPNNVVIVAPPEPRPAGDLRSIAVSKTFAHLLGDGGHRRMDHLRVAASNATEFGLQPFAHLGMARHIGRFSTMRHLQEGRVAARGSLGVFPMMDDEFYALERGPYAEIVRQDLDAIIEELEDRMPGIALTAELPGGHDELLVNPSAVLRGIKEAFGSIGRTAVFPTRLGYAAAH